jgi:hypothetical protein
VRPVVNSSPALIELKWCPLGGSTSPSTAQRLSRRRAAAASLGRSVPPVTTRQPGRYEPWLKKPLGGRELRL